MKLVLLRHGDAVNSAPSDFERTLTDKGVQQAETVGDFYNSIGIRFTHIYSSPYLRAKETAEIVASSLEQAPEVILERDLGCGMDYPDAFAILRLLPEESVVLFVGHQPDFGAFTSYLIGSNSGGNFSFKKACSAFFEIYQFAMGGGLLESFVPVKTIKSLSCWDKNTSNI